MLLMVGSEVSSGWKDRKEERHLLRIRFDVDTYVVMLFLILFRKESGSSQTQEVPICDMVLWLKRKAVFEQNQATCIIGMFIKC